MDRKRNESERENWVPLSLFMSNFNNIYIYILIIKIYEIKNNFRKKN